jgi:magnesium chelatase subunit D
VAAGPPGPLRPGTRHRGGARPGRARPARHPGRDHPEVDKVSAHLLDRFALRVDAKGLRLPWDPEQDRDLPWDPDPALARIVKDRLAAALPARPDEAVREPLPGLSREAVRRVLRIVDPGAPGARRYLALGRLARALTALSGDPEVLPRHVNSAAELAGLFAGHGTLRAWGGKHASANGSGNGQAEPGPVRSDGNNGHLSVRSGESAESEFIPEPTGAYPEDTVQPTRDAPLLRLGWQRMLTGPPRGQPIGTRRALGNSDIADIAVAATILNAARFQRLRCQNDGEHYRLRHQLHLKKWDLLSYRRAPQPGQLLVLLLDHTCRTDDWDWYQPLSDYLGWAYVNRALVGVVEVGAPSGGPRDVITSSDLRATRFQARGVLDRRVLDAIDPLDRPPGRATPLAHGLSLVEELLRRSTQQGGPAVSEAIFVAVTDGRANVPLAHSKSGTIPEGVGLTAFDDSLGQARKITALDPARRRTRSVVIDPGWQPNGRLAAKLAVELRAALEHGTPGLPPASASAADDWPESGGRWRHA